MLTFLPSLHEYWLRVFGIIFVISYTGLWGWNDSFMSALPQDNELLISAFSFSSFVVQTEPG